MQELIEYLESLLNCAELNQDDLEPETRLLLLIGQGYVKRFWQANHREE